MWEEGISKISTSPKFYDLKKNTPVSKIFNEYLLSICFLCIISCTRLWNKAMNKTYINTFLTFFFYKQYNSTYYCHGERT